MPGTVSNPATLQSVINVFGSGGSPINLFAYRRGAGVVPNNAAYNGVSTTEPALSTFAGLVYPVTPNLPDFGGTGEIVLDRDSVVPPPGVGGFVTTFVRIYLNSDGTGEYEYEDYDVGVGSFLTFTWLPSGFSASAYSAYMDTPTGDSFFAGPVATTSTLSISRTWAVRARASTGQLEQSSVISTLRIKDSSGNDLISKPVTMTVSSDNGFEP